MEIKVRDILGETITIEDAILLSPSAKSYAVPALWCDEDDIMGNHSASSGKLSKESS